VGFFFCAIVGDLMRTKILMVFGLCSSILGVLIVGVSTVLGLSIFGLFLIIFGLIIGFNLTFIFVTEMVV
jgi:hypothetical protein